MFPPDPSHTRQPEAQRTLARDELIAAIEQSSEAVVIIDVEGTIRHVNPTFAILRAEAALRESEANYRLLLESTDEAICGSDLDGRCTFANPAAARMLGVPLDRLVGAHLHALVHHSRADGRPCPADECRIRLAVARGESVHADDEILWRPDGTWFPVEYRSHPVSRNGDLVGAVVTFSDISRRRLAEDSRRRSEEWFRTAFCEAPFPMTITTPSGAFVQVNTAFCELVGYSEWELLELGWDALTYPEDRETSRVEAQRLVAEQRNRAETQKRYVHKSGRTIWAHVKLSVVPDAESQSLRFITHVEDISERRAAELQRQEAEAALRDSEERLRQIADNMREVFWLVDTESGRVEYVSAAYETVWGCTRQSLYNGSPSWIETVHPEDGPRLVEGRSSVSMTERRDFEYRIVQPDGAVRWIRERVSPVVDADGSVRRVAGVAEDITVRRQLEMQLLQSQKMESIGQLAGGIAHDFNNILGGISGYTHLALMDAGQDETLAAHLEGIRAATERAADLVRQIVTFSSHEVQEHECVRLAPIVDDGLKLLRASIPSSIAIHATIDPHAPPVRVGAKDVHQIVMNLGTNAWHAIGAAEGMLIVKLDSRQVGAPFAAEHIGLRQGLYTVLTVQDTGCGMDARTVERIFDPFFTTKAQGEGTGLGLSTVHGIMKTAGGAVLVDSSPGEGSRFQLYFPAMDLSDAPDAGGAPTPGGQGERIFVIDDEVALTRVAKSMLERLGYHVEGCANPIEAIEALASDPGAFDLVITDLTMPGASGLKIAGFLHRLRPNVPIVLTTGNPALLKADDLRRHGISDVIAKPVSMHALGCAVYRALARRRAPIHGSRTDC